MSLFKTLLETWAYRSAESLFELASNRMAYIAKKQGRELVASLEHDNSDPSKAIRALAEYSDAKAGKDEAVLTIAMKVCAELAHASEKHLQWVVNKYIKLGEHGQIPFRLEDAPGNVKDTIEQFEEARWKLKKKDLMQYKTFAELDDAITSEDFDDEPAGTEHTITPVEQHFIDNREVKVVHRGDGVRVYVPETYEASQFFGRGTKWCTASKKTRAQFDSYSKQSPLYIVYAKGKKYQLHFASQQFMDARDRPADIAELFSSFPILYKLFAQDAKKTGVLAMLHDDVDEKVLRTAIDKHQKNNSRFDELIRDLSSTKLARLKPEIERWMKAEHLSNKNLKYHYAQTVKELFSGKREHLRATRLKLQKVYTSAEMFNLLEKFWGSSSDLIEDAAHGLLVYALTHDANGVKLRDSFTAEIFEDRPSDSWVAPAEKLMKLGYPIEHDKLVKILMKHLEFYNAEGVIKQAITSLKIELDEATQLKMVEINATVIRAFENPSNRVKERARMSAKRNSENSWRQ